MSVSRLSFSLVLCGKCQVTAGILNMSLVFDVIVMHKGYNVLVVCSMYMYFL